MADDDKAEENVAPRTPSRPSSPPANAFRCEGAPVASDDVWDALFEQLSSSLDDLYLICEYEGSRNNIDRVKRVIRRGLEDFDKVRSFEHVMRRDVQSSQLWFQGLASYT